MSDTGPAAIVPPAFLGRARVAVVILFALCGGGKAAADAQTHDGVEVGFTDEGHPYIGSATAPLTLEEWSDYLCPYCRRHFELALPKLIDGIVQRGELRVVFRDLPIPGLHPNAVAGHAAARCAGEQGAAAYWRMHDALFRRQAEWGRSADPLPALARIASELKLDRPRYDACMRLGNQQQRVEADATLAASLGYRGTPSFRFIDLNGETVHEFSGALPPVRFEQAASALLAGEEPPGPARPELPLWARSEGLAPDSDREGYTVAGDPYRGDPDAPVTVIAFQDFECRACRNHKLVVQPELDRALVDAGKVRWVEKHFPMREHAHALLGSVAAECAGEQQQYWPMQSLLFSEPERWLNSSAEDNLLKIAGELKLNRSAFRHCLVSRHGVERVLDDLYDAQGLITKVPTFVIIADGQGATTGPLSAEQFIKIVNERLPDGR